VYLLDSTLRQEFQALSLRARGGASGRREWFVDGTSIGSVNGNDTLRWPLARGTHEVEVRDDSGHAAVTHFVVR
jgi:membrane carboxypeptidase/penicillin-binding protein PbpC